MIARSLSSYFWFGTCVRYLQDVEAGLRIGSAQDSSIRMNMGEFFRYLDELGLVVTKRASQKLEEQYKTICLLDGTATLSSQQAIDLKNEMTAVRRTLQAELAGIESFVLSQKRFDVNRLMREPSAILPPDVFSKLTSIARFDFTEACRAIAIELPTAAAFHLMRALEATLRSLYESVVKRRRASLMWGPIVEHLRKTRFAKTNDALLAHLDHIRRSFRNPTQHPEAIYGLHEAQDLLGLAIDALGRMVKAHQPTAP